MNTWTLTHPGYHRRQNQDRYLVRSWGNGSILLAIADGMGGEPAGDLAAQMTVDQLAAAPEATLGDPAGLVLIIREACSQIYQKAQSEPELKGMGTTLTAAVADRYSVHWAHVGDSRLHLFTNGGTLTQITADHTLAYSLVEEGVLSKEDARTHPGRHLLLDCVGCGHCEPDAGSFKVERGDQLLLTTDGLHDKVPEKSIAEVMSDLHPLKQKMEVLLRQALKAGGEDNITIIGLEI